MFLEWVTTARTAAEFVHDKSRLFSDPPDGLLAVISWETGDDDLTTLTLWETPAARGDFAVERMMPLFEAGVLDDRHGHPERLTPVKAYVRA